MKTTKTKLLKRMKKSPHRIIKHVYDGFAPCDICSKKGAAIAIVFGDLKYGVNFDIVGPVWMNNKEIYWVGSSCLKDLKKRLLRPVPTS